MNVERLSDVVHDSGQQPGQQPPPESPAQRDIKDRYHTAGGDRPTLGELIDAYLAEHRRQSHGDGQLHQSPQSLPVHGHPSLFVQISAKKRKPPARPGWRSTHHGCGPHASITWIGFDGSAPASTQSPQSPLSPQSTSGSLRFWTGRTGKTERTVQTMVPSQPGCPRAPRRYEVHNNHTALFRPSSRVGELKS